MNRQLKEALNERLKPFAAEPGLCELCDQVTHNVGVSVPDDSQKFGAPQGKERIVVYRVCGSCSARPGSAAAIENGFLEEFGRRC